jgi:hypothetical protein
LFENGVLRLKDEEDKIYWEYSKIYKPDEPLLDLISQPIENHGWLGQATVHLACKSCCNPSKSCLLHLLNAKHRFQTTILMQQVFLKLQ